MHRLQTFRYSKSKRSQPSLIITWSGAGQTTATRRKCGFATEFERFPFLNGFLEYWCCLPPSMPPSQTTSTKNAVFQAGISSSGSLGSAKTTSRDCQPTERQVGPQSRHLTKSVECLLRARSHRGSGCGEMAKRIGNQTNWKCWISAGLCAFCRRDMSSSSKRSSHSNQKVPSFAV